MVTIIAINLRIIEFKDYPLDHDWKFKIKKKIKMIKLKYKD